MPLWGRVLTKQEQRDQDPERLRLDRHELPAAAQLVARLVEHAIGEAQRHDDTVPNSCSREPPHASVEREHDTTDDGRLS